jgi:hypothetical protein
LNEAPCIVTLHWAPQITLLVQGRSYSAGIKMGERGQRRAKEEGQLRQLNPDDTRPESMYRADSFLGNWLFHPSVTHMLC